MTKKSDQDTLMQLHKQNIAKGKIIENQKQKFDRILDLTYILTSKILPKYETNEVPKKEILVFVSALHQTILGENVEKER